MGKIIILNNNKAVFSLVLSLLCFCFLCSCKSGINDMLDDYNSHYTPTEDPRIPPKPGDPDFRANDMLSPIYPVDIDGSVNLTAPFDCTSYLWTLTDKQGKDHIDKITFYKNCGNICREFRFYIPDSDLELGTYKITLTVTDADNNSYTDTAALVIYETY